MRANNKNLTTRIGASARLLVAIVMLSNALLLSACSVFERRGTPNTSETKTTTAGNQVSTKDSDFDQDKENGEVADSAPTDRRRQKKVGIILGPGGAKALAEAGVLKELQRARIPIQEVIGLEWGALIGGLFAQRGQAHEMEWKLYKLEKQDMPGTGFLSSKLKPAEISSLRGYLKDSFSQLDVQRTQIPFSCPSQTLALADWRWSESGLLAREIEGCMAYLPLYDVQKGSMAAAFAAGEAAERLRKKGVEVVILVNVLNSGTLADPRQLPDSAASAILWQEIRRSLRMASTKVDEWIEVDTSAVGLSEFARRKELFAAGEKAGQLAAKRLIEKYGF